MGKLCEHVNPRSQPFRLAGSKKQEHPAKEIAVGAGLNVERAGRVKQPRDSLPPNAGHGEGNCVAGDDQPCVAIGTASAYFTFLNDDYAEASFEKVIGGADSHRTAANDEDVR